MTDRQLNMIKEERERIKEKIKGMKKKRVRWTTDEGEPMISETKKFYNQALDDILKNLEEKIK